VEIQLLRRLLLFLIPIAALLAWLLVRGTPPPEVPWVAVTREPLVSTLTTNGKVEPIQWAAVHAEIAGPVERIHVQRGQSVHQGQILATISAAEAQAELSSARSRIAQAHSELEVLESGGPAREIAEIESDLQRARTDLDAVRREVTTLERLAAKKAATAAELSAARERMRAAELQIESLERRRRSLVSEPDRRGAQAKMAEAQSGAEAASKRIASGIVRSPLSGVLYALETRAGDFVQPGQLIARVGQLSQLRVILYVDEPELGRVAKGMPVIITWDALPGREWKGQVETVPLQVVPIGTRQVGEVICTIDNPDVSLIPGTNINAEVRSKVIPNALVLPKETLRREGDVIGVFVIQDDKAAWRPVKTGAASVTKVEVLSGVTVGDRVALPVDSPLTSGEAVRPIVRP
jgi:HlyD family secretion protein